MGAFDDRFTTHSVFQALEQLRTHLTAAEEHLSTTKLREAHARLVQVADHIERVLEAAEPALTSKSALDGLGKAVQNTANEVQTFVDMKQANRLVGNANNQADTALLHAGKLYVPLVPGDVEGLRDDVANFRRSASQHLRYLEQEVEDAKTSLDQQVQQSKQAIAQTTSQIQTKLDEVENTKQGLENARQQFQGQFSEAQDRRSTEFSTAVEERTKKLQEFFNDSRERLDEQLDALVERGDEYIEELDQRKAEVEKLVGAIGADALSGGFNKTAAQEGNAADFWRGVGVVFFAAAIAAAALLFGPLHEATELTRIGAKAVVVLPLIGLGTYAFKESGRHRRVQWRNRRLALELASIDPYLAHFEDGERNEVKKELVSRWFAQPSASSWGDADEDDYSPSALVALAEKALGMLGKRI